MGGMTVIITGSLNIGIVNVFGPFDTPDEAVEWADRSIDGEWYVYPLEAQDQDERGEES